MTRSRLHLRGLTPLQSRFAIRLLSVADVKCRIRQTPADEPAARPYPSLVNVTFKTRSNESVAMPTSYHTPIK